MKLLQKYKQWLVCFLAGLLLVVLPSVVFAQKAPASTFGVGVNTAIQQPAGADYQEFANSHLERSFY
ncbi:hypothetical protein RIVM261_055300 [Rivularia sp. IAM M-261]|nr:hypothetical protein CAL7716_009030 [Calothrix sp. PCC 7716]GJD20574.1 hypothetical protein RIVM261_055300 [Rivularia sp. IAM M-261]